MVNELEYPQAFIYFSNKDEWKLLFNGSKWIHGARVEIILIKPNYDVISISYHLLFYYFNDMANYEALILCFKAAILLKVKRIKIFGDSQLVMK